MRRFVISAVAVIVIAIGACFGVGVCISKNTVIGGLGSIMWYSEGTVLSANCEDRRFTMTVDQRMRDYLWEDLSIERIEAVEVDCSRISRQQFEYAVVVGEGVEVSFLRPVEKPVVADRVRRLHADSAL